MITRKILLLSLAAWSSAARLSRNARNYLPPPISGASGGNENLLQPPEPIPFEREQTVLNELSPNNGFVPSSGRPNNNDKNYPHEFGPNGNGFNVEMTAPISYYDVDPTSQNGNFSPNVPNVIPNDPNAISNALAVPGFNNFGRPKPIFDRLAALDRNTANQRQDNRVSGDAYNAPFDRNAAILRQDNRNTGDAYNAGFDRNAANVRQDSRFSGDAYNAGFDRNAANVRQDNRISGDAYNAGFDRNAANVRQDNRISGDAYNAGFDRNAAILRQDNRNSVDSYNAGFNRQQGNRNNGNAFNAAFGTNAAAFERNAAILRQENRNNGDAYNYAHETENGISAQQSGNAANGVQAQGGYSYTGDDGRLYSVRYTADQNGFRPQGDHLPTPPPIPEEIRRALEKNAIDEANGIFDDGSYNERKYESGPIAHIGYPRNMVAEYHTNHAPLIDGSAFHVNEANHKGVSREEDSVLIHSHEEIQSGIGKPTGIEKVYLPPTPSRVQRVRIRPDGYPDQGKTKYNPQSVMLAYLPPDRGQKLTITRGKFAVQRNQDRINTGVERSYLPPASRRSEKSGVFENHAPVNGYLPPRQAYDKKRNGLFSNVMFTSNNNLYY